MAIGGFIFGGEGLPRTPQELKRLRDIAEALQGARRAPDSIGEGLMALGDGIVANVMNRRAARGEAAGNASARSSFGRIAAALGGSPVPSVDPSISTGSTTSVSEGGGGGGKVSTPSSAKDLAGAFIAMGYSPAQAAGIVGNLAQESGLRASGAVGDQGSAFGLAQWRGERFNNLKNFAAERGGSWEDPNIQAQFIHHELNTSEKSAGDRLRAARTPEEAAAAFIGFERPRGWTADNPTAGHGWANRRSHSVNIFNQIADNSGNDSLAGSPDDDMLMPAADGNRPPMSTPAQAVPQMSTQADAMSPDLMTGAGRPAPQIGGMPPAMAPRGDRPIMNPDPQRFGPMAGVPQAQPPMSPNMGADLPMIGGDQPAPAPMTPEMAYFGEEPTRRVSDLATQRVQQAFDVTQGVPAGGATRDQMVDYMANRPMPVPPQASPAAPVPDKWAGMREPTIDPSQTAAVPPAAQRIAAAMPAQSRQPSPAVQRVARAMPGNIAASRFDGPGSLGDPGVQAALAAQRGQQAPQGPASGLMQRIARALGGGAPAAAQAAQPAPMQAGYFPPAPPAPAADPQPAAADMPAAPQPAPAMAGNAAAAPGELTMPMLIEAFNHPFASEAEKAIIGEEIERLRQNQDPLRQIQIQQAQLELEQARNPAPQYITGRDGSIFQTGPDGLKQVYGGKPDQPTDVQEYEYAKAQGYPGSFTDWQIEQKRAGASSVNIDQKAEGAFEKKAAEKQAETFDTMATEGLNARADLAVIGELETLLAGQGGTFTGLSGYLAKYGIGGEGIDDIQAAQALINKLVPTQRQPGSGTMSDRDVELFTRSLPSLWNTPGGNQRILNIMRGLAQYKQAQGEIADQVLAGELTRQEARRMLRELPNPLAEFRADQNMPKQKKQPAVIDGYTIEEVE